MVFPLGGGDQLGDVVVTVALTQTQRTRLRAVGLRGGRRENLIYIHAQRRIDHLLEGLVQLGRALPRLGGDVGIERQRGSHTGIMMLGNSTSTRIIEAAIPSHLRRSTTLMNKGRVFVAGSHRKEITRHFNGGDARCRHGRSESPADNSPRPSASASDALGQPVTEFPKP